MHPLVLPFLVAVTRQETAIELRFRPEPGRPLVTRRTIEAEFHPKRAQTITLRMGEQVTETPLADRTGVPAPDDVPLRVSRKRDAPILDDPEQRLGPNAVFSFLAPAGDEFVVIGADGDRSGRAIVLPVPSIIAPSADDVFVLPTRPVDRGDVWISPAYGMRLRPIHRFEDEIRIAGERIALISLQPSERLEPYATYGAWAVRVRDGVILRSLLTIALIGDGTGQIRYESVLDGAPTWDEMNVERWKTRSRGRRR